METAYPIPTRTRLTRSMLRPTFRSIFRLISRVTITGKENVPTQGPYLIAINHVSIYDPPLVVAFWPAAPEVLGAIEVWHRPGQNILVKLYGCIPVHRSEYDRRPLEKLLWALRSGHPVLIAPEGHRSHKPGMNQAQPGIAFLIEKFSVPIIPAAIVGTTDDFLQRAIRGERPEVAMQIGKAISLPTFDESSTNRKIIRQKKADLVMAHIAALLPPEYRGFYNDHLTLTAQTVS